MYIAIYNNQNNNETKYYYLNNNELYYNQYLDNQLKTCKAKKLNDFYDIFSLKQGSIQLEDDEKYNVYLDFNGYKHYINNGKEDFLKFYNNNGIECMLYQNDNISNKSSLKKFVFNTTIGTITLICSLQLFSLMQNNTYEQVDQNIDQIVYVQEEVSSDPIEVLNNYSNIPDNLKETIIDSGIIQDVSTYYDDVHLSILNKSKLNNLSINYFDESDIDTSWSTGLGSYSQLEPNVINLRNGTDDATFYHEFVHLLQSYKSPLPFFDEPVAELMLHDYFGYEISSYTEEVNNLKLLISTIGYEPILKCSFGGDESEILEILSSNLDTEDYDEILSYLRKEHDYLSNGNKNKEMQQLIEKLYFNIYGIEMKDNLPEYQLIVNSKEYNFIDDRCYLNPNKVDLEGKISFCVESSEYYQIANNINILSTVNVNYYIKNITQEEYENINGSEIETKIVYDDRVQSIENRNNSTYVNVKIDDCIMSYNYQTAVDEGYVKYYIVSSENEINIDESWIYDHTDIQATGVLQPVITNFLDNTTSRRMGYTVAGLLWFIAGIVIVGIIILGVLIK